MQWADAVGGCSGRPFEGLAEFRRTPCRSVPFREELELRLQF